MDPSMQTQLILPVLAMVALTLLVWLRMYFVRVAYMKKARVHPQKVATRAQAVDALAPCSAPADNFQNLFELPVLFYALVGLLLITGLGDALMVIGAWAFVALRVVHSLIHVTYNRVMHRFWAYCLGGFVMFALWARFAWQILVAGA